MPKSKAFIAVILLLFVWTTNHSLVANAATFSDKIIEIRKEINRDNLKDAIYILNAEKVFPEDHRVHFKVKIDNDMIPFDLRFVGDDYYDIKFEKDILNDRIINNGFYVPNDYFHFYSLIIIQNPH